MLRLEPAPRILAHRYLLDREIGRGGNGVVWRAWDRQANRWVAVKQMRPQGEAGEVMRAQFLREARLAAAVQHPNVVGVSDFGVHAGDAFMVMELVTGVSLYEWLQTHGVFEPRPALALIAELLEGVAALHEAGIVHRDLKPENVMLAITDDGLVPKLLDFGLAKVTDPSSGQRSAVATRPGFAFGTPHYMAPEQALGTPDLDGRCDVYGAGVLLYEMLSGEVPFDAPSPEQILLDIIGVEPVPLASRRPGLPTDLLELVAKATARRRRHRFESARAMAEAARSIDPTRVGPPPSRRRRPRTLWATAAAALLGLTAYDTFAGAYDARAERTVPELVLEMGAPRLVVEPSDPPASRGPDEGRLAEGPRAEPDDAPLAPSPSDY